MRPAFWVLDSRGWILADQAVSNVTNVLGLAIIGRWLDPESFGVIALTFTLLPVAVAVARGMWGEALLVLSPVRDRPDPYRSPVALGGALLTGTVFGGIALVVAVFIPSHGPLAAVAALFTPLLLLHDTGRYIRFAEGRAFVAFISDVSWLLGAIAMMLVARSAGGGPALLLAGWFGGLLPATAIVLSRVRPRLGGTGKWLRNDKLVWAPLLGETVASSGFRAVALVVLIAASGLVDGGGFRAAQVAMGPVTIATLAAAPMFLYAAPSWGRERLWGAVCATAVILGMSALAWLAVVVIVPSEIGEAALGAAWSGAEPLIRFVGVYHVAAAFALAPFLGLRSIQRTEVALALRVGSGVALVGAAWCGAAWAGVQVAAISMAAVEGFTLLAALIVFRRVDRAERGLAESRP